MRVIKWILIFLGFFITIGIIQCSYETSHRLIFGRASYSTEAIYLVPQTDIEIILERRAAHLFLAEYERTLVLRVGGKAVLREKVSFDTGGYSRMNIYQISPTEYFLSGDINDKYTLDITQQKLTSILSTEKPSITKFIGAFDRDEKRKWRFITAIEREEQKSKFEIKGDN